MARSYKTVDSGTGHGIPPPCRPAVTGGRSRLAPPPHPRRSGPCPRQHRASGPIRWTRRFVAAPRSMSGPGLLKRCLRLPQRDIRSTPCRSGPCPRWCKRGNLISSARCPSSTCGAGAGPEARSVLIGQSIRVWECRACSGPPWRLSGPTGSMQNWTPRRRRRPWTRRRSCLTAGSSSPWPNSEPFPS